MLLTLTIAILPNIATPNFPAVPRALVSDASQEKKNQEEVRVTTSDKLRIAGTFYAPKSKTGNSPAALLVHDAGADKSQLADVAEYLQKKGFGVLTLDLRGHGKSVTEDVNWAASDEDAQGRMWSLTVRDLKAGAAFLSDKKGIHASNLTVVGIGAGSSLAVRHAVKDENVRAVVLISPQSENFGFNLIASTGDLAGLPTLIMSAKDDRQNATRLVEAGHRANDGLEYIDTVVMKSKRDKLLEDRRLKTELASWMRSQAMPKKK